MNDHHGWHRSTPRRGAGVRRFAPGAMLALAGPLASGLLWGVASAIEASLADIGFAGITHVVCAGPDPSRIRLQLIALTDRRQTLSALTNR